MSEGFGGLQNNPSSYVHEITGECSKEDHRRRPRDMLKFQPRPVSRGSINA